MNKKFKIAYLAAIISTNCLASSEVIDQSLFTATATSEELSGEGADNGNAIHAIDGDPATFWHTNWSEAQEGAHVFPFTFTIALGDTYNINKFDYLPRVDRVAGAIETYEVFVSTDGVTFTSVASGTWLGDNDLKEAMFTTVAASHVQLVITTALIDSAATDGLEADSYAIAAEFNVFQDTEFVSTYSKIIDSSAFTATASSEELSGEGADNGHAIHAIDGNDATFWHTNWSEAQEGANIFPFTYTIDLGTNYNVNKLDYLPRVDRLAGAIGDYELFISNDGINFTSVASGTWAGDNNVKEATFDAINARYVQIVITSASIDSAATDGVEADDYAIAAEFNVYEYSTAPAAIYSEKLDSSAFTATATSEELSGEGADNGHAIHAIDGNDATFWHTNWSEAQEGANVFPFTYTIALGDTYNINKFDYLPRVDRLAGAIETYEVLVSTDGVTFTSVASGTWLGDNDVKEAMFANVDASHVQILITSALIDSAATDGIEQDAYAIAAEFNVFKSSSVPPTEEPVDPLTKLDSSSFVVTASSEELTGEGDVNGQIGAAFDGDITTFWHTEWNAQETPFPHTVSIDLGNYYDIERFDYTPRGNGTGQIADFSISLSSDDVTYDEVSKGTWAGNDDVKQSGFDSRAAKYVRLTATSEASDATFAGAAEFAVLSLTSDAVAQPATTVLLDSSLFTVSASTEELTGEGDVNGHIAAAFDGDVATFWHSEWNTDVLPEMPFTVDINLNGFYDVNRLDFTPRGNNTGQIGDYEILTSQDGVNYTSITDGSWSANDFDKSAVFTSTLAQYVRLVIISEANEADFIGAAEIQVFASSDSPVLLSSITAKLDSSSFMAVASSEELVGEGDVNGQIGAAFDGDLGTFWHTQWEPEETPFPHTILIDLGNSYDIAQLDYNGRTGNPNGTIAEYEIYVSDNCRSFGTPIAAGEWEYTSETKEVSFEAVTGRYVKVIAYTEGAGQNFASASEIAISHSYAVGTENPEVVITPESTTCSIEGLSAAPYAARDVTFDTKYNTELSGSLPSVDGSGDALSYALVSDVTNGTLTLETDGSFTYMPSVETSGNDTFTVSVTDINGATSEAIITIDVAPKPFIIEEPKKSGGSFGSIWLLGLMSILGLRRKVNTKK
ncbi:discoidin domain-containing protein [Colwellia sp. BRX8-7]|jgi:hypothetical protein|uniref:discoidin domain-containing protein n=1 Tax=Colwellia sp. BRX8-7 TaxID=2759833 RepID=UPI0015F3F0FE|nr:discoidin domain-containing protein [Colwellia sp. BRX8-7]MBA6337063.1 discoidin domain-containing protein [Colwellia sp. BRX8-7]